MPAAMSHVRFLALLTPVLAGLVCSCAAPAASAEPSLSLRIEDRASFDPSDKPPDNIHVTSTASVAPSPRTYPSDSYPTTPTEPLFPSVEREGIVIAEGAPGKSSTRADLRGGDVIVVHDATSPGYPEVARYPYYRGLRITKPVCAGLTTYDGMRTLGSTMAYGSSALWLADPAASFDEYPAPGAFPGGSPGWAPSGAELGSAAAVGVDRFRVAFTRPTTVGMRLTLGERFQASASLEVELQASDLLVNCEPTPPRTQSMVTKKPVAKKSTPKVAKAVKKDTQPPQVALSGMSKAYLAKLGRETIIAKGVAVGVTSNEWATLGGSVILISRGKKRVIATVHHSLAKGANQVKIGWYTKSQKAIRKSSPRARIRFAFTVTDKAGNVRTLPLVTLRLPRPADD